MSDGQALGFEGRDVPTQWRIIAFEDIADLNCRHEMPRGEERHFVSMERVRPDGRGLHGFDKPQAERKVDRRVRNNDTLFAKISPGCENGKVAIVRGLEPAVGLASKEFHVFSPRGDILPEYLFLLARTTAFRDHAVSRLEGISERRRVPPRAFEGLYIALPPLDEQRAIWEVVAAADAALDAAEQVLEAAVEVERQVTRVLLAGGSGNDPQLGRLPTGWMERTLQELADVVVGATLTRAEKRDGVASGRPVVTSGAVHGREVHEANCLLVSEPVSPSTPVAPAGSVIIVTKTKGITRGNVALLTVEALLGGDVMAVVPREGVHPRLLLGWFECHRDQILAPAVGTASISRRNLESLRISLPPPDEHAAIVAKLEAAATAVEKSREEVKHLAVVRRTLTDDLVMGRLSIRK